MMSLLSIENAASLYKVIPGLERIELYSFIRTRRDDPEKGYFRCISEVPDSSGVIGLIFPPLFQDIFLGRIIWSLEPFDVLYPRIEKRAFLRDSLVEAVQSISSSFENRSLGISILKNGKTTAALVLRYKPNTTINIAAENIIFALDELLESLFSSDYESIWPQMSLLRKGWSGEVQGASEFYRFPMDFNQIRSVLGDSECLFYEDVFPGFLARLPEQLEEISEAASRSQWSIVRKVNHQIKGAAATLYITNLGGISCQLEKYIDKGNLKGAFELQKRLQIEAEILEKFYQSIVARRGNE